MQGVAARNVYIYMYEASLRRGTGLFGTDPLRQR